MILQLFIFHDPIILVPIDQHILLRAPEVTNLLDTKSVNTNLYQPLNFPSKDIDQLSYTTTSSLSQARSNSVSTAITTLTTASSCKSHISPV